MITKEQVLEAFDIIEKYQDQLRKELGADSRSISLLGLNTRELNCLKAAEIETIGELLEIPRDALIRFRNIGKKGIIDINKKIKDFGIDTPEFHTR